MIRCVAESESDRVKASVASRLRMVFRFNVLLQIYGSAVLTELKMSHRVNSLNFKPLKNPARRRGFLKSCLQVLKLIR